MPFFGKKGSRAGSRYGKRNKNACESTSNSTTESIDPLSTQHSNISLDTSTLTPRVDNTDLGKRYPLKSNVSISSKSSSECMSFGSSKYFVAVPTASKSKDGSVAALGVLTENNKEELLVSGEAKKEVSVDYDVSPTLLYKFIEYKDWDEAILRCQQAPQEAKTWVVRYETDDTDDNSEYEDYENKVIRWKMLPIHEAVIFNAPMKLITSLLSAYPAGVATVDDRKMTPLHLCCRSLKNVNIAQFLVLKDSDTLKMTDYKGRTPFEILKEYRETHKSAKDRKNYDTLIKLLKDKMKITGSSEESFGKKSTEQYTESESTDSTYNESCDGGTTDGEDSTVQESVVTATDESTMVYDAGLGKKSADESTVLPIPEENSEDSLLAKSQSAAYTLRNMSGSSQVVDNVVDSIKPVASSRSRSSKHSVPESKSPNSSKSSSKDEDLGVPNNPSMTIIPKEEVGKNYIKRGTKKKIPVNNENYDSAPTQLIKLIEQKMWDQAKLRCLEYPEEASTWMIRLQVLEGKKKNDNTEVKWKILPIHSAIVLQAPVEMIEALVDAYPQGLRKGDDREMLPLHMAFRLGASPETTAILVDSYPDALKKKDSKGHTPLHILKAYKRKYLKEARAMQNSKSKSKKSAPQVSKMDRNRKKLIKFYLGGRTYGDDDDVTLAAFDSDREDSEDSADDESIIFEDDDDYAYDSLFHKNMFTDFGSLAKRGISHFPVMVRDTFACR